GCAAWNRPSPSLRTIELGSALGVPNPSAYPLVHMWALSVGAATCARPLASRRISSLLAGDAVAASRSACASAIPWSITLRFAALRGVPPLGPSCQFTRVYVMLITPQWSLILLRAHLRARNRSP